MIQPGHEYGGYRYDPQDDREEDNTKIFHDVYSAGTGRQVSTMDWSPYSTPTAEEFKLWVELGMPTRYWVRKGGGPLTRTDLEVLDNRGEQAEDESGEG